MKWLKIFLAKLKMQKLKIIIYDNFAITCSNSTKLYFAEYPELRLYKKGHYSCYFNKELKRYVWLKKETIK